MIQMIKYTKSSYFPMGSIQDKKNYKIAYLVKKDGTIIERVFLDIADPRQRENIICLHFLKHLSYVKPAEAGVSKIIKRDSPWDFRIISSSGEEYNLEITSIADDTQHFINNKREEELKKIRKKDVLSLNDQKKIISFFPEIFSKNDVKIGHAFLKNPLKKYNKPYVLVSRHELVDKIENKIRSAIEKKMSKRHLGKKETILIVDNRTWFEKSEAIRAIKRLRPFVKSCPFREIWFYTGYYSDDNSNNAEFELSALE